MKESRRMKRLAKSRVQATALSLTSLMDIFTILLLYLLVNQSDGMVLDPPKEITLPESIAQTTPRETLVVMVSDQDVVVQGEPIVTMEEVRSNDGEIIESIRVRMVQIRESAIGLESQSEGQNEEVTVLVDRDIEFQDVKRVMASCTAAGYTKISLAVNQK
jgi:biopolymer transport protein ExbD